MVKGKVKLIKETKKEDEENEETEEEETDEEEEEAESEESSEEEEGEKKPKTGDISNYINGNKVERFVIDENGKPVPCENEGQQKILSLLLEKNKK